MRTPESIHLCLNAVSMVAPLVLLFLYHHDAVSTVAAMAMGSASV